MWFHLLILSIALGFSVAYDFDLFGWYEAIIAHTASAQLEVFGQALIGLFIFVLVAGLMAQIKAQIIIYPLARLLLEASLFVVTTLAFGSLYIFWALGRNPWQDLGVVGAIPFLGTITASLVLFLYDFNYPYRHRLMTYITITAISLGIITVSQNLF